uniref:SCP domain-containing protein n=1 Tax=Timema tahoe TaxID=61484 RepID=A0A7R9P0K7_9NEOP|nr:unnamed protein product [Timema tahoe]
MALNIWKIAICLILGPVAAHAESSYCQLCRDHTMCIYSPINIQTSIFSATANQVYCEPRQGCLTKSLLEEEEGWLGDKGNVENSGALEGTSGSCGTVIRQQLTNAEQDALVNIHNTYRSKVARGLETRGSPGPQPSASNMRKMNWNDELATIAQTWVNQCMFGHDSCRETSGGTTQTGHYTQVVWANTYQVGCGYIKYKVGYATYNYVVCDYGPSGNYLGQELYKTGAACSQCGTMVCDTTYPGLCRDTLLELHLHDSDTLLELHLHDSDTLLELHWCDSDTLLELHWRDSDPVLELHWRDSDPVIVLHCRDSDPVLELHCRDSDPVLELHCRDSDPVLELHWRDSDPVLELHWRDSDPVIVLHLHDSDPVIVLHLHDSVPAIAFLLLLTSKN